MLVYGLFTSATVNLTLFLWKYVYHQKQRAYAEHIEALIFSILIMETKGFSSI